jgi:hypothetical protein
LGIAEAASRVLQDSDSTYDMPYTFAYVMDVAVKSDGDSSYSYYSSLVDTGSSNLGKLIPFALASNHFYISF